MKKEAKCLLFLLTACMLLTVGCTRREEAPESGQIDCYYLNKEATKLVSEPVELKSGKTLDKINEMLDYMTTVPSDVNKKAAFSGDFDILSVTYDGSKVAIEVSEKYRALSPSAEILTRAAIVRNLTQIDGVDYVTMNIQGDSLTDRSGNPIGPMEASMFIDNTGNEINAYEKTTLKLFFANEAGDKLIEASRTVVYNTNISLEKLVVEQLIKGPNSRLIYPVMNPETKVNSVTVKDGICYVNLGEGFLTQTTNVSTDATIYAITNSLVELPNINKVQISVEGNTDLNYRETVPLSTIFERNYEIVVKNGGSND
ncbi:MAG: GerMN domain-containing protein [Lachnospiraceae bacterium]|nr:GerMN domain-containing protein [Lachnospiraceae bacterium]